MSEVWKIEKYARYLTTPSAPGKGQWQQYDDNDGDLVLTLTDSSHLVLCRSTTVMESHSLVTARAWMRGMTKRDSMLLMYKVANETRRFRLKFYGCDGRTAEKQCAVCAEKLSKFFPVKMDSQTTKSMEITSTNEKSKDAVSPQRTQVELIQGEVTLGKMAQVVSGHLKARLPVAYQHCDFPPEEIKTVIRLCLTDPSFPAFVQQVDTQLQKLIADDASNVT
ncbi:meiotic recombination protein REC114-like [Haliotis rufescens]|uniref:meiotic recombination protein REC114-like n=1 Tax=Haliotis rufescens TaxID=6454 RepID=UPI00201FABA0|nr:meiotic recombination protein REC114-like [Haliotis rufescens]XP_046362914.2 meiotic recombination protein REC114-like [Haliotis rufescens]XP_046362915.2 meiotic recombination protein REC114-like [Haliotis rufescens]